MIHTDPLYYYSAFSFAYRSFECTITHIESIKIEYKHSNVLWYACMLSKRKVTAIGERLHI